MGNENNSGDDYWGPDHYRFSNLSLLGKVYYPISNYIDLHVAGGVSRVHEDSYNMGPL
jgi:hypothetical protein